MAPIITTCMIISSFLCILIKSTAGIDERCTRNELDIREGRREYLPCKSVPHYDQRWWYSGLADTGTPLYHQIAGSTITNKSNIVRPDMKVDTEFQLSLLITLADHDTVYTCDVIEYGDSHQCNHIDLKVVVQPEIILSGINDGDIFADGEEVTVTCTLERVYPEIENLKRFWLRMGKNWVYPATRTVNKDSTFRYEITATWVLNVWDKYVNCEVRPTKGERKMKRHSFIVQGSSTNRAAVGVTLSGILLYYLTTAP